MKKANLVHFAVYKSGSKERLFYMELHRDLTFTHLLDTVYFFVPWPARVYIEGFCDDEDAYDGAKARWTKTTRRILNRDVSPRDEHMCPGRIYKVVVYSGRCSWLRSTARMLAKIFVKQ
jgi:hypothetical protein